MDIVQSAVVDVKKLMIVHVTDVIIQFHQAERHVYLVLLGVHRIAIIVITIVHIIIIILVDARHVVVK